MDWNAAFAELWASNRTLAFVLLVTANVIIGAMAALKDGKFTMDELAGIFDKKLVTMALAFAGVNLAGDSIAGAGGDVVANGGSLVAAAPFLASSLKHLWKLLGGTPPKLLGT